MKYHLTITAILAALLTAFWGCAAGPQQSGTPPSPSETAFLDTLQERTFLYFWNLSNPGNGLTPDRAPTPSFASVAAVGFALTACPIGAERGYITRAEAAERVLKTLRFFLAAPQDTSRSGSTGYRGFYYHFLDSETGRRFAEVELSTVDTALLLGGALFCQSYFDRSDAAEESVREAAESLYVRTDWTWAQPRPPTIVLGWKPEEGFLPYDWRGYNEAMLLYILALGSPTYPVGPEAWDAWTSGYRWGGESGGEHVAFAPLFGHQYTHVWIDFRGIQDDYMRKRGIDYFENSRRATYYQREYAIRNPEGWTGYDSLSWGLTACDGPVHREIEINGKPRQLHTYWARGASFTEVNDDGTLSPTAAAGSIAFAPEIVIPTLTSLVERHGTSLFSDYGFLDSFNPSLTADIPVQHGVVRGESGWFDTDYLGIDQGPIVTMIENYRTGLVWNTMRRNPHIVRGLRAAGFTGGWLDSARVSP